MKFYHQKSYKNYLREILRWYDGVNYGSKPKTLVAPYVVGAGLLYSK